MNTAASNPPPHPEIAVTEPNAEYAKVMLGNIGGQDSEMSAVSLYLYNQLVTPGQPEISAVFQRVAREEMRHLELFGRLAFQLGADPRLWEKRGRRHTYWSPRENRYTGKLRQIVSNALVSEYMTAEKYAGQIKTIGDPAVMAALERVLQDEREHIRIFRELLRQV